MKPTPKTGAQRVHESETRKKEQGLVKCWAWVYPEDREALRKYATKLRANRDKAR